ncbi:uncharacterized protein LOC115883873 [Sitophilus oryzae]|uniref:Uncharacterized protein LOC115883873 n=1 Tax=Sitophilus oryzae TaxID=7048 RepID=A0A6J2Y2U7_SITOR|nr:uncharacterized protein LOC115883873 [Sitophilus oryzae]
MDSDVALYMMSFLRDYNYPLIHSMSDEKITEIFHISNRCFLISWLFKVLDEESYSSVLEDREQDKNVLGNLICSYGFCMDEEKAGFFNGDLPMAEQVQILYRIFKFIANLKKSPSVDKENLNLTVIDTLVNTNLNIFPSFGELKPLSEKEKIAKLQEIQLKSKKLQLQLKEMPMKPKDKITHMSGENENNLEDTLNYLRNNLSQFDRIVKAIDKDKNMATKSNYKVNPDSEQLFSKCNKNLKIIYQYIEDLNTINNFKVNDVQEVIVNDELSPLIDILVEQIQSISKLILL